MHPLPATIATLALVYRAYSHSSLTPLGILFAALTAIIHASHISSLPFVLLGVFFLSGTAVTKVKKDTKARLTLSATGASGGEGPRTHIQVLANSAVASVLVLLSCLRRWSDQGNEEGDCWAGGRKVEDLLLVGVISNYAAVTADTFSSELGILSSSSPRLLTSWTLRKVPPGTNGGVSLVGTAAGFLGSFIIGVVSVVLVPFCGGKEEWGVWERGIFVMGVTGWGGLGSLVDSALGGLLQASVIDGRTGKVVEGTGGGKVLVTAAHGTESKKSDDASRKVVSGWGVLDNNQVNFLMAAIMSFGGMIAAGLFWGRDIGSILAEVGLW